MKGARAIDTVAPARQEELPPAAARWLARAVRPGAEGLRHAELTMHGEILAGRWRPFRARQVIDAGDAFTWSATAGRGPLAIRGWDRYADGAGGMRWRVLGVPVVRADGPDVSRSAAGRLAGETVLCPPFALGDEVRWSAGADDGHATFTVGIGPWRHDVTVAVDPEGGLRAVDMVRWGDPDGTGFGPHDFHVEFAGAVSAMGVTIPGALRAGWRDADGAVRDFFRATI
ncbi:MAG TPA: DUF6544 family protein, partial [Miltoncostaea sp.]|nr:DUF6544 family protein [Miltoncostaea sp.]